MRRAGLFSAARVALFAAVVGSLGCVRSETRLVATTTPPMTQVARLPHTHVRARVARMGPVSREVVTERFSACVVLEGRVTVVRAETTASPRIAPMVGGVLLLPYVFLPGAEAVALFGATLAGSGPLQARHVAGTKGRPSEVTSWSRVAPCEVAPIVGERVLLEVDGRVVEETTGPRGEVLVVGAEDPSAVVLLGRWVPLCGDGRSDLAPCADAVVAPGEGGQGAGPGG